MTRRAAITVHTDARSAATTYSYDALNRVTAATVTIDVAAYLLVQAPGLDAVERGEVGVHDDPVVRE
jgi:YD repeat-containing protein